MCYRSHVRPVDQAAPTAAETDEAGAPHDYLQQQNERKTPWELGKGLFGKHSSGRNDLSTNAKVLVREKIHAKKGRR